MDAVEFLKELKRRSKSRLDYYGEEFIIAYIDPESLVAQVEQWAKEHPIKTRQSEFLKLLPNASVENDGVLSAFPCHVDIGVKDANEDCRHKYCLDCRRKYWAQEVE